MESKMRKSHKRRGEAGLALVEFAIAVPLLMLLVLGGIELGRYAYFSIVVGNAARAGVQYGAQNLLTAGDSTGMSNAALTDGQNVAGLAVASPAPGIVCSCWNGTASSADTGCDPTVCPTGAHRVVYVQVTMTGTMSPLFNYPLLPGTYTITRQAVMRVSSQ